MSGANPSKRVQARDLKQRVLTCLHKLSDRDTHAAAASELESIAKTISADALPPFLTSIAATDSSDKSPVRRQCLRLISVLSEHHGNSLSPHLSKLLLAVVRRLRDPDSSVRAACVAAAFSVSSHITSPPFNSVAKPFLEALFIEQDSNSQNGVALCLAAVIEGSRNPDAGSLRRLLARLEKLAKCEGFKAKPALLSLMASVVGVNGVLSYGGKNVIKNLIMCLIEFLNSQDWAARKAAAEALTKIAEVEKEGLSEYKTSCLKTFEAKRFDKVKAARETMNKMIDAWKEIPDLNDEDSPLPETQGSSKEIASDGRYPPGSRISIGSTPEIRKRNPTENSARRIPIMDGNYVSTAKKRSPTGTNDSKTSQAMFRKFDRKKSSDQKVENAAHVDSRRMLVSEERDGGVVEAREERKQFAKSETKRALFSEDCKKQNLDAFKTGSAVVSCGEEISVVVSNETGDLRKNQRDSGDIFLIQRQLLQIENQQANLLNVLQRFIGSSQNGMHSLEARVHGLELALDEISFDLAVSTGRIPHSNAAGAMCCKLPGVEFLSSKLWRKTEPRPSNSTLPLSRGTPPFARTRSISVKNGLGSEGLQLEKQNYRLQVGRGLIVNPLAEVSMSSQGVSGVSSSAAGKNISLGC